MYEWDSLHQKSINIIIIIIIFIISTETDHRPMGQKLPTISLSSFFAHEHDVIELYYIVLTFS